MTDTELFQAVRSGWPQLMAILAIVWWARRIDLRSKDAKERLDRHDARMRSIETSHQSHAIQLARMEEALGGIKLTLDRIYAEMRKDR